MYTFERRSKVTAHLRPLAQKTAVQRIQKLDRQEQFEGKHAVTPYSVDRNTGTDCPSRARDIAKVVEFFFTSWAPPAGEQVAYDPTLLTHKVPETNS